MVGLEINDNYRSNYIQITRAKEHLSIYTIDKNWLINHLTNAQKMLKADKTSAYEVMNPDHKQLLASQKQEKLHPIATQKNTPTINC